MSGDILDGVFSIPHYQMTEIGCFVTGVRSVITRDLIFGAKINGLPVVYIAQEVKSEDQNPDMVAFNVIFNESFSAPEAIAALFMVLMKAAEGYSAALTQHSEPAQVPLTQNS